MKSIKHIEAPKEWESENDWDSHRPLLYLALQKTNSGVVEMGSGKGSTLLLDGACQALGRSFLSVESTPELGVSPVYGWSISRAGYLGLRGDWPEVLDNFISPVLFVDCAPGELRKDIISEYANDASVIISHDTEPGANYVYGMADVLSAFKYRLSYEPEGKPHTTVVSNFINVEEWI